MRCLTENNSFKRKGSMFFSKPKEASASGVKPRDPYFDNIKGFLIMSVIFCHMMHDASAGKEGYKYIYTFVLAYVMPAFVFISGYFSKNVEKGRDNAVKNFLVPFVIFNFIEGAFIYWVDGHTEVFHDWLTMATPYWALWYLLTMFFWKMLAPDLKKLRYPLLTTLIIGLLVGFCGDFSSKMALGRTFSFLFFFTLGLCFKEEWVEKIRKMNPIPAIIVIVVFAALVPVLNQTMIGGYHFLTRGSLFARKAYPLEGTMIGFIRRVFMYFAGTILTVSFLGAAPKKETFLTKMGRNSISVYVFHIFIVYYLRSRDFYDNPIFNGWQGLCVILLLDFCLAFILSRDIVRKLYFAIVNTVDKLLFSPKRVKGEK